VLLFLSAVYFVYRPVALDAPRVDAVSEVDRDDLARFGAEDESVGVDEINSETTRARENPHTRHDVDVTDELHCVQPRCIGCVGVPQ
jgi:hypothetical protein